VSDLSRVEGKAVVITGAASGIGRALARRFARARADLALLDRDLPGVERLASELSAAGVRALPVRCDVTNWEECQAAMRSVMDRFGGVDILINNAGITHLSPFSETQVAVVRAVMEVNFFGAVHCTKAALDSLLARRGLVVVISSVAGFSPLAGRVGYAASKHALHGFFESLRAETQARGLRVMMVCPGFTDTNIGANALGGDGGVPRSPRTTLGKAADPARVADAIFRGVLRQRQLLVLSPVGKLALLVSRLSPALYGRLMARSMMLDSPRADPPPLPRQRRRE